MTDYGPINYLGCWRDYGDRNRIFNGIVVDLNNIKGLQKEKYLEYAMYASKKRDNQASKQWNSMGALMFGMQTGNEVWFLNDINNNSWKRERVEGWCGYDSRKQGMTLGFVPSSEFKRATGGANAMAVYSISETDTYLQIPN